MTTPTQFPGMILYTHRLFGESCSLIVVVDTGADVTALGQMNGMYGATVLDIAGNVYTLVTGAFYVVWKS